MINSLVTFVSIPSISDNQIEMFDFLYHENASSNVILIKSLQPQKAFSPMLVTLSGIMMLVKLLHSKKAQSPMLVTSSGIVMLVKLLQLAKR